MGLYDLLADSLVFLKWNLKHYSKALPGIGLKLLPNYPPVSRFFPTLIRDSVLEWRVYGLIPVWGLIISTLPFLVILPVLVVWMCQSIGRVRYFRSPLAFWKQAAKETPSFRNLDHYCGELIRETERALKRNDHSDIINWMDQEAFRIQDRILALQKLPDEKPAPKDNRPRQPK